MFGVVVTPTLTAAVVSGKTNRNIIKCSTSEDFKISFLDFTIVWGILFEAQFQAFNSASHLSVVVLVSRTRVQILFRTIFRVSLVVIYLACEQASNFFFSDGGGERRREACTHLWKTRLPPTITPQTGELVNCHI